MSANELWLESYQGEVLGEALFGLLAQREADPTRRHQLQVLSALERTMKELAEPVLERRSLDSADTEATISSAGPMADGVAVMSWEQFLGSFEPVISQYLERYRQLVELATDDGEREVAEAYVAHELAISAFCRRALGREPGEPLQPILDLPQFADTISA